MKRESLYKHIKGEDFRIIWESSYSYTLSFKSPIEKKVYLIAISKEEVLAQIRRKIIGNEL